MSSISTSKLPLDQVSEAMTEMLTEYQHALFETRQDALQAGAEVFKSAVEAATPTDTGEMAQSWQIKTKYKDRRYIGNTKTVSGGGKQGIPLSNVLEYGENSPHSGFIRRCFDENESKIFDAIKKTIQKGGN